MSIVFRKMNFWQKYVLAASALVAFTGLVLLVMHFVRTARDPQAICPEDRARRMGLGFLQGSGKKGTALQQGRKGMAPAPPTCNMLKQFDSGRRGYLSVADLKTAQSSNVFVEKDLKLLMHVANVSPKGVPVATAADMLDNELFNRSHKHVENRLGRPQKK